MQQHDPCDCPTITHELLKSTTVTNKSAVFCGSVHSCLFTTTHLWNSFSSLICCSSTEWTLITAAVNIFHYRLWKQSGAAMMNDISIHPHAHPSCLQLLQRLTFSTFSLYVEHHFCGVHFFYAAFSVLHLFAGSKVWRRCWGRLLRKDRAVGFSSNTSDNTWTSMYAHAHIESWHLQ